VIGQEITIASYEKGDTPDWFPMSFNFRSITPGNYFKAKFNTKCYAKNPVHVGDRFGPFVVTGYTSTQNTKCHLHFTPRQMLSPAELLADTAIDRDANLVGSSGPDANSEVTSTGQAMGLLVGGLALLFVVTGVVAHTVWHRDRRNRRNPTRAPGSSSSSPTNSHCSHSSGTTTRMSAIDAIDDYYRSDPGDGTDIGWNIQNWQNRDSRPSALDGRSLTELENSIRRNSIRRLPRSELESVALDWDSAGQHEASTVLSPKELDRATEKPQRINKV
jgi:hypothetical protein